MQTQVNLYRDYEHRIQAMNRDQPDPRLFALFPGYAHGHWHCESET